jgi:hypothetical protein
MDESLSTYLRHLPSPLPWKIATLTRISIFFIFLFLFKTTTSAGKAFGYLTFGFGIDCG